MRSERMRTAAAWSAACALLAGVVWAQEAPKPAEIYGAKCASCHGKDGKGNAGMAKMFKAEPGALDLTDEATLGKSDADLAKIVSEGSGKMPPYKAKLDEASIAGVVAYFRGLGAPDGASLFSGKCASCHGKDGKGNAAMAKMLKVEPAALDLLDKETLAKTDEELVKTILAGLGKMPAYKGKLTDADVAAIVKFLRALAK